MIMFLRTLKNPFWESKQFLALDLMVLIFSIAQDTHWFKGVLTASWLSPYVFSIVLILTC